MRTLEALRRWVGLLLVLVVVAGACGGDGDEAADAPSSIPEATATTTPAETEAPTATPAALPDPTATAVPEPTATPAPTAPPETAPGVWSVLQVDPEPPNGGSTSLELTVLPDGRPRVIYGVGTSLRMGTCVDVGCSSIDVVEILDTAPFVAGDVALSAAVRGDGSPVIALYNFDPARPESLEGEEQRLVWCEDVDCTTVVSTLMPQRRYFGPSLTSAPDGTVAVVDVVSTGPVLPPPDFVEVGHYVGFELCDGPSCLDEPDTFDELQVLTGNYIGWGGARAGFDADGRPLALFFAEPAPSQVQLSLVACSDRECLGARTQPVETFPGFGMGIRPPLVTAQGELVLVYQQHPAEGDATVGGRITVTACSGTDCTEDASVTTVVHENPPFSTSPFDGALGPDQLPRLVRTTTEGFLLITCDDLACTQFETSELVPYRAWDLHLATAGDGAAIVTTADDRNPSDGPNIAPGLWLHRCDEPPCEPPEPPS